MTQGADDTNRSHTPKGKLARERILRAAEPVFVDRGFHGASMRDIALAAEVPLATVVYHFAKKEKLYAALLAEIADHLMSEMNAGRENATGESRVEGGIRALIRWSLANPGRVRLIVRELADNPARVSKAAQLPLQPVLMALVAEATVPNPETAVLNIVGAVSYVVTAWPTIKRMIGARREKELLRDYEEDAMALARRTLGIRGKGK
jgi:AcrR family transcriptional regulator